MDVGEGVEANPLVGRNGAWNQNIEKGHKIDELRRQVMALMEVVQLCSLLMRLLMSSMTLILFLRTLLELLQGVDLMWKEMSQGLTTTSRLKF